MPQVSNYTIESVALDDWDALLSRFDDRTVFHSAAWLRTVRDAHRVHIGLASAVQDDECMAVWPFWETRKGPLRVLGSPLPGWSTAYLGPLFKPEADISAALGAFLSDKLVGKHAYFACKTINRTRAVDLSPFGFTPVMQFDTYRVDLSHSVDDLWNNLKSECRTRIRKARKLGVEIRPERGCDFIPHYWQMSVETFEKSKIEPTHDEKFVHHLWENLEPAGAVQALSAFDRGERIATLVLIFDHQTMYYWGGASYIRYREIPAHNLLHWQAICDAKQRGLAEYDFISTCGGPGRFKKTFGPAQIEMATHWEHSQSRLIAALKNQYQSFLMRRRRIKA